MEPQVDFYPGGKCYHHHGHGGQHEEHYSESSDQFAENLAEFIQGHMEDIDEIVISLDSHNVSELHALLKAIFYCRDPACCLLFDLGVTAILCAYKTENSRGPCSILDRQARQLPRSAHHGHAHRPAERSLAPSQGREHGIKRSLICELYMLLAFLLIMYGYSVSPFTATCGCAHRTTASPSCSSSRRTTSCMDTAALAAPTAAGAS
jgi:hypothetical protein